MDKVCFKCGKIKSIDEFYKHPKMKDGHFNKCKECAKKDVHDKYNDNIKNPDFVDKERERGREKYKRLGYASKHSKNYKTKSCVYKGLSRSLRSRGFDLKYKEAHHWDYDCLKSGFILSRRAKPMPTPTPRDTGIRKWNTSSTDRKFRKPLSTRNLSTI